MVPTEAGLVVHRYAMEVLRSTEEVASSVRSLEAGMSGRVTIGANIGPGTYTVPATLTAFKLRHPGADIFLLVSDSEAVYAHLADSSCDVGVVAVLDPPPHLHVELLRNEPFVLVTSPDHPLAGQAVVDLQALADEDWVCSLPDTRRRLIDMRLREFGLPHRRVVMTMGHPEALKQAVRAGIGIAMLYRSSVQRELQTGELAGVRIEGVDVAHPFYLVHASGKRFSPLQQQLLDFMRAECLADG